MKKTIASVLIMSFLVSADARAAEGPAAVQFVGLFVFSTRWSADEHLQAVAPRVHIHEGVAEHAVMIVFPACSYVSSENWAPVALEATPGYLYVRLDGERVTLGNGAVTAKKMMNVAPLGLPHLTTCFFGMEQLKPEFQPDAAGVPAGAAAVFDLPTGTARACLGRINETDTLSRIDTVLTMNVGGDLVISSAGKSIRLKPSTHVVVANVPAQFLEGAGLEENGEPHYEVYFAMGLNNEGDPVYTDDALANFACAKIPGDPPCEDLSVIRGATKLPILDTVDYECSNTQWP